jgi:hypothetical protein
MKNKKKTIILVSAAALLAVIAAVHTVGGNFMQMIQTHMGL